MRQVGILDESNVLKRLSELGDKLEWLFIYNMVASVKIP